MKTMQKWVGILGVLANLAGCGTKTTPPVTTTDAETADTGVTVDAGGGTEGVVKTPASWVSDPAQTPKSIHMTWQHDPATTVTVQWTTAATSLEGYTPKVWLATAADAGKDGVDMAYWPTLTAAGSGEVYYQTISDVASDTPSYITWTVEVTGLKPGTDYVFRAGTWSGFAGGSFVAPNLSDVQHFRTAPAKGSQEPFTVVLAGDSRGGTDKIRLNGERLGKIDANFWIFNGDFNEVGVQEQWDDWFDAMKPILSQRPLMPVQGNHEIFSPTYYGQFALPNIAGVPDAYKEHAWSMTYGNVHFVGLDSLSDAAAQDQAPWLDADLQAARADKDVDWIVVMMHHAAYSSSNHGSTDWVIKNWVPLFEKYDVDLVFSGHDHDYERSFPWRGEKKADKGPVYVVAGGFYADGYGNGKSAWTATSTSGAKSNYVVTTFAGKKVSFIAYSGDGSEKLDTYAIQK